MTDKATESASMRLSRYSFYERQPGHRGKPSREKSKAGVLQHTIYLALSKFIGTITKKEIFPWIIFINTYYYQKITTYVESRAYISAYFFL